MLRGTTFFCRDRVWTKILADLGAVEHSNQNTADFTFIPPAKRMNAIELRGEILRQIDAEKKAIIKKIFGPVKSGLSDTMEKIVIQLYRHGGQTTRQLNEFLGYSENTKTHTADTAIYQLRKSFGAEFIQQSNGIYSLGGTGGKL